MPKASYVTAASMFFTASLALACSNSDGAATASSNAGASGVAGSNNVAGANSSAGAGAGGQAGDDGSAAAGGAGKASCKRGVAANVAPGAAFSPALSWWYNWSATGSGQAAGIEFTPMIRAASDLGSTLPAGSRYLLGFNEPNFQAQANLTPAQAAAAWPQVEALARAQGLPIVSPAVNFCGTNCNGTDPYQYLKDFFAACTGCQVDYVAVHWYDNLPSLKDYLEPGGSLEGFEQFNKPIWLTEFSLNADATATQQEGFMLSAIQYLESNPHVFRYAWFSADPIPNAKLINDDGTPTDLGLVYLGLPGCK